MDASPIAQIEAAMVAQLRIGFAGLGVEVENYSGQLDDDAFEWIRTLPAIWVSFDEHTHVEQVGANSTKFNGRFVAIAAARVLGPEPDRRQGNAGELGVYQLQEQAKITLANMTLGLPIEPINVGAMKSMLKGRPAHGDAVAVYAQYFSTWWVEYFDKTANDPPLNGVNLNYFLSSGHTTPDASDSVDLTA